MAQASPVSAEAMRLEREDGAVIGSERKGDHRLTFAEIMRPYVFHDSKQPSAKAAAPSSTAVSNRSFPFGPVSIPLVPPVLRKQYEQGFTLHEAKDPLWFMELCPVRGVGAFVAGGVMGLLFGAVFAGMGSMAPYDPALRDFQMAQARADAARLAGMQAGGQVLNAPGAAPMPPPSLNPVAPTYLPGTPGAPGVSSLLHGEPPPSPPMLQAFKEGLVQMKERSVSSARNFAIMGGLYTTIECSMETVRGKKDIYNAVGAGFGTGAILAARAGPAATVLGGAGFAAFSIVIEMVSPYLFDH